MQDAPRRPEPARTLTDYLEASARAFPDRVAVVDPDGTPLTYRELNDGADRVAACLAQHGVQPGDRVGIVLPKSANAITALFGIMKARAAYVPVDHTAPLERNRTILADCDVRAAFLSTSSLDVLQGCRDVRLVVTVDERAPVAHQQAPRLCSWFEALAHAPTPVAGGRHRHDLAYILYTSGSTGVPKGVMLTHENATAFVEWCASVFQPTEHDRFSNHAPFHFDLSVLDIYLAVRHGAELHLVSEELGKNPKDLARFIAARRISIWYSTPSILRLLVEHGHLPTCDCSSLRLVLFAGEVFPVKHLRHLRRLWPQPRYFNLYGPTETNVCTFARIPDSIPDDRTTPYPIGWPCSHCRDLVLDAEGNPVPPGEEGLLYICGPSVFQGYWNRPELNARAFLQRDGLQWYCTGDIVRLDPEHGYIYVGRRDRMVKRRGYRIELGEVERALYEHPQLGEVAVVSVPDESSGVRLVAYVAARHENPPSIVELKAFCARHLPSYMSPDIFRFLPALPRTSTDKVDYQRLVGDALA
jgi:amino acid adenylation domain-containing protein